MEWKDYLPLYFRNSITQKRGKTKRRFVRNRLLREDNKQHNDGSIYQIIWDPRKLPLSLPPSLCTYVLQLWCTSQLKTRPVIAYWSVSISSEADQWTTHCNKAKQRKPDHAGRWQTHQRAEAQMLLAVLMKPPPLLSWQTRTSWCRVCKKMEKWLAKPKT